MVTRTWVFLTQIYSLMVINLILKNLKVVLIILFSCTTLYFYQTSKNKDKEIKIQTENSSLLRKLDSLRFATQILSKNEIKEYLEFQNKELKSKLIAADIKSERIKSLVSIKYRYKDTVRVETDISELVESIKKSIPKSQVWSDTTECLKIKGSVFFDGQKLKVIVSEKIFTNQSDGIVYWERRKWNFLGLTTRLFGKKVFTSKQFDQCGESKVLKIEKKE